MLSSSRTSCSCCPSPDGFAQWRNHFPQITSCPNADFDPVFATAISDQFRACCVGQATGECDTPFSESEFIQAVLGFCHRWRWSPVSRLLGQIWLVAVLDCFNFVFERSAVPPAWKSSETVPVFKHVDRTVSRAFKVFEHFITHASRLASSLAMTICAFIDIRQAFDAAWVVATLVRLAQIGVTGGMWRTITNFLVATISQVRIGDAQAHPWMDLGIAQGRALSPPLFNLLVNSSAADIHRCWPGVHLAPASDVRFVCQLCAHDLAILAASAEDLQRGLNAVSSWSGVSAPTNRQL